MKNRYLLLTVLLCFFSLAAVALPIAFAQESILQGGVDDVKKGLGVGAKDISFSKCIQDGSCGAEHIFVLANNIIRWLAGVSGAVALLMYVIGGIWMIFSAGNASRVERGKDIIIGTSVALVSILGSWVIINFVLTSLGTEQSEIPITIGRLECGNTQCLAGQTCQNNICVSRCEVERDKQDPVHEWFCQDPGKCEVTYEECEAGAINCAVGLCPGGRDNVCCYRP